jgi:spore coat polysaccharide biosynthesis predicted glycosyltransferase SpsG
MTGPRILFVVNAGAEVGGGHVMRSLTLAQALEGQGASFAVLGPPAAAELLDVFAPQTERLIAASAAPRDLAAAARDAVFDAVAFDHYDLSQGDHRAISDGRPALVIDDLADRPLGADLVLDAGPERRAEDYETLVGEDTRLLLGPAYAPVRPDFAALREPALAWRGEPVQRVLVAMGLTDVGGITARVVERLRPRLGEVGIDISSARPPPACPA